ncbi:MAG TPA: acetyl/propionyl/methylcrotonyl-CoA carboxylase subunit alpha [Burkholderiales bacterium]|nr:acetyl/propionyl/methylcrotonyl-CoA carboxylase subunit alpha [Burkholderiales bacterium]
MFRKILIANRGEIACRVAKTARRMGIGVAAVYSDADANARHVSFADEAFRIGPAPPSESYLKGDAILEVARRCGAEAIHPGYGFLSENEDFAAACAKAAIVFIGPPAAAIAAMGDKARAKALMAKAGVPIVPGYHGEKQDAATLALEARRVGFPVLVKASAGGGGKGMRIVRASGEFERALEGAQREARSSFGDDRVLLERYLERPRHIEVQVFGDAHGNVLHVFERDCSVQRRHQKVLEEAPAPAMTDKRRKEIGAAAVAAAKTVGYVGAGTVEFIVSAEGEFFFMEMNTRLQVEHPVTEMVTGLDLVEWQLRVAAGEPLPLRQEELAIRGHAIEARIYAENPDKGFLPSTGALKHLRTPPAAEFDTHLPVRVDSGVREGDSITPYYDPMIAKLVCWGESREIALARMSAALGEFEVVGPATNIEFLGRAVRSRAFTSADLDTGLIERERAALFPQKQGLSDEVVAAAACAELFAEEDAALAHAQASGDPYSPWHRVDGWRLNQGSHHRFAFSNGDAKCEADVEFGARGYGLRIGERTYALQAERREDGRMQLQLDARTYAARAVRDADDWHVFCGGACYRLRLEDELQGLDLEAGGASLAAPMPGKVIRVLTEAGAKVTKGDALVILEAMKMEHTIAAPRDGVIAEIFFRAGDQVNEGAELLKLEET